MLIRSVATGFLLFCFPGVAFLQPFAPAAGRPGSTALHADSHVFVYWADSCVVQRGPAIITVPDSLEVTLGEAGDATGKAGEGRVVSLGDGGMAWLYFDRPVTDGPGSDFAVFENAFSDTFLELAFVEVSSDGIHYQRFPSESLTSFDQQVGTFGSLRAEDVNNLAGKYRAPYGTPFDLAGLEFDPLVNVGMIRWIRIIDVVGCIIDSIASRDIHGNIINDPWPTPFHTGGFDLDAVGVINGNLTGGNDRWQGIFRIDPNPFRQEFRLRGELFRDGRPVAFGLYDITGNPRMKGTVRGECPVINTGGLPEGIYVLMVGGQTCKLVKIE